VSFLSLGTSVKMHNGLLTVRGAEIKRETCDNSKKNAQTFRQLSAGISAAFPAACIIKS
jgi:hypothetical protein